MKKLTKTLILLAIAALAATIVTVAQQRSSDHEAAEEKHAVPLHDPGVVQFERGAPQLAAVRSEAVKTESMPTAEPVNGRFVYDESQTTRVSSPLVGRVLALHAGPGDRVARGAALLDIDSPDLANAEADLAKFSSEETRKRLAAERTRRLYENEIIARKELEAAEADFQQAQADTRRATLRLRSLQASGRQDGKFVLKSPISGTVVERNSNLGQEVRPESADPLFLISNIGRLWVLVDVPERSLSHVHIGQIVGIETDAWPEQRFTATVQKVGVAVDPVTRRVQVRCSIDNADGRLKPEMFARVFFLADGERKGIRVPNAALVTEGIYSFVFVETELGRFERRKVGLAMRGTDHSFIESGLSEGDHVVVEGALLLNSEASADAR